MRLLVPYDGSACAAHALDHAVETFSDARLTVLHVIDPTSSTGVSRGGPGGAEAWYAREKERSRDVLAGAIDRIAERDVTVETTTETGRPASTIVAYATTHDIDAIVMGTHGRKRVARLLVGSVALSVVEHAPVPVTVVREPVG